MEETVDVYHQWKDAEQAIKDARELLKSENDEEMREFLHSEITEKETKMEKS